MMLQTVPSNPSNVAMYITLVFSGLGSLFGLWTAYKLQLAKLAADDAKKVSDQHTTQIQEVKALVNGSLGQTLQTGLTAAKALVEANPAPANIALAADAQKAVDAHTASQDAINASIATGAKPL